MQIKPDLLARKDNLEIYTRLKRQLFFFFFQMERTDKTWTFQQFLKNGLPGWRIIYVNLSLLHQIQILLQVKSDLPGLVRKCLPGGSWEVAPSIALADKTPGGFHGSIGGRWSWTSGLFLPQTNAGLPQLAGSCCWCLLNWNCGFSQMLLELNLNHKCHSLPSRGPWGGGCPVCHRTPAASANRPPAALGKLLQPSLKNPVLYQEPGSWTPWAWTPSRLPPPSPIQNPQTSWS